MIFIELPEPGSEKAGHKRRPVFFLCETTRRGGNGTEIPIRPCNDLIYCLFWIFELGDQAAAQTSIPPGPSPQP